MTVSGVVVLGLGVVVLGLQAPSTNSNVSEEHVGVVVTPPALHCFLSALNVEPAGHLGSNEI